MKTIKSSKTLKFDLADNQDVFLEITVSSTGTCSTLVTIPEVKEFDYEKRVRIGSFSDLKGRTVEINHEFSFEGIPKKNLDNAIQQTQITYSLLNVIGPLQPFKKKTSKDLDSEDRISSVKFITIQHITL
ncbi:hypothetical protein [Chryseobacterium indologenes]|uniref:hypothetical protein n=1 Tax=Chryseobacterium indologenes TaxID=253 RepID=UPI001BCE45A5|nr:hypothetical protein [Chryseobacterium indologenes]